MLLSAAASLASHGVDVVLASASPRRRALMQQLLPGVGVRCVPSTFAEDLSHSEHESAASYALATAKAKSAEVWQRVKDETSIMIAADTVVVGKDGKILEKPTSPEHACSMLHDLSGTTHEVVTAVVLTFAYDATAPSPSPSPLPSSSSSDSPSSSSSETCQPSSPIIEAFTVSTRVAFTELSDDAIQAYVDSKEPMDKAGGYGYQSLAATFVSSIEGCYYNVVGLPLHAIAVRMQPHLQRIIEAAAGATNTQSDRTPSPIDQPEDNSSKDASPQPPADSPSAFTPLVCEEGSAEEFDVVHATRFRSLATSDASPSPSPSTSTGSGESRSSSSSSRAGSSSSTRSLSKDTVADVPHSIPEADESSAAPSAASSASAHAIAASPSPASPSSPPSAPAAAARPMSPSTASPSSVSSASSPSPSSSSPSSAASSSKSLPSQPVPVIPGARVGSSRGGVEVIVDDGVLVERAIEFTTLEYEVTQLRSRGRKQERILRLTPTHIQNVRGKDIISRHGYEEVFSTTLTDHETLVISYGASQDDFVYASPVALTIVAEINARIGKRRAKEKANLSQNLHAIAQRVQEKVFKKEQRAAMRKSIAAGDSNDSNGSTLTSPCRSTSPALGPSSSPTSSSSSASSSSSSDRPSGVIRQPSRSAMKLQQLFGTSHDERVQMAVESLILEPTSDAGKARLRFVKNLPLLERNPQTMLSVVRQFMDALRQHVEAKNVDDVRKIAGIPQGQTMAPGGEEEMELGALIERGVQSGVVLPGYQRIMSACRKLCAQQDEAITAQLSLVRSASQSATASMLSAGQPSLTHRASITDIDVTSTLSQSLFGIPLPHQNRSGWSEAIEELNDVDRVQLPCDKIKCLVDTAKAIYRTFNRDRELAAKVSGTTGKPVFLSADDFFPPFVFVVAQSRLQCLDSTRYFITELADRESLNGEGGYYLTVFEAAIEYIKSMDIEQMLEQARQTTVGAAATVGDK